MSGEETPREPSIEKVLSRLETLKKSRAVSSKPLTPAAAAGRAAVDFASACAVGGLLGYGVDYWLGTTPWGIVSGIVIGTITGFKLMWQVMQKDIEKNKDTQ